MGPKWHAKWPAKWPAKRSSKGLMCFSACAFGQQYGPVPARPQFAGATLVQPARASLRQRLPGPRALPENVDPVAQLRRAQPARKVKPQSVLPPVPDQQRTNFVDDVSAPFTNKVIAPTPVTQFQTQPAKLTPRPVEEQVNEDEELATTIVTTPSTTTYTVPVRSSYPPVSVPAPVAAPVPLQPNNIPAAFQRSQFIQPSAFRPAVPQSVQHAQPVQYGAPPLQGRQLVRQQARPIQNVQLPVSRGVIADQAPPVVSQSVPEDEQYFRQVQTRPLKKQEPVRQQFVDREPVRQLTRQPENVRQQPVRIQTDYSRPVQREPHVKAPQRERKPVAQTIRKYHEEHEDGSITWGYENDDGSFKEETIGVDCVTRGKYGYFDPDGVKREYTYQTGIPCDKVQEAEEAASNHGFIDYTNNKYVLPNGDEIDLEAMVKNRARKPVSRYNNRA